MAQTNQFIENPVLGDKLKFLITAEDSKGEVMSCEIWLKPLAQGPPLHYHPIQSETFEVKSGKLGIEVDGKKILIGAGENTLFSPMPHINGIMQVEKNYL